MNQKSFLIGALAGIAMVSAVNFMNYRKKDQLTAFETEKLKKFSGHVAMGAIGAGAFIMLLMPK